MQAKDIPDVDLLAVIAAINDKEGRWAHRWDLHAAMPDIPPKVLLAKCRSLIRRKLLKGCACGCRGDFEVDVSRNSEPCAHNEGNATV